MPEEYHKLQKSRIFIHRINNRRFVVTITDIPPLVVGGIPRPGAKPPRWQSPGVGAPVLLMILIVIKLVITSCFIFRK
jgi:hypothetical protein